MADYDEELSEIESEVDRLTRQVSGHERFGQSTPKYMATGDRHSIGFPVDSGFATARHSRERASAQRESTHNLPYCKFKVQQIIKQETYLQFKQFIYTTRIPQCCHQFCNAPGIY
jgi:hypothetical protein